MNDTNLTFKHGVKMTVYPAKREDVGGCNGCTSKDNEVTVVELRSTIFRLCNRCRLILFNELAK